MPLKTHMDEQPTLNLTPMIDIVFLLIIFFMVGTKFTELERKIGLQVPEVTDHGALTAAPEKRVVNVYRDGTVTLDRDPVSLDELRSRLTSARMQYEDLGVLIRGDSKVVYQSVAEVFNTCKLAGINQLAISVRPITVGSRPPTSDTKR
ncbi:MAG: biopolymer transporter ExbD [Pirellulales bacterium]|nr:biopolymer transporter ExbD [Pirellulales bacterium]